MFDPGRRIYFVQHSPEVMKVKYLVISSGED
jgi:hypothetical protein